MRIKNAFMGITLLGLGCTSVNSAELTASPAPKTTATVAGAIGGVTVEMISATLAEDCGGTGAPYYAPPEIQKKKGRKKDKPSAGSPAPAGESMQRSMSGPRACQQTSMQLSVVAGKLTDKATISVKKVEFFDKKGKLIGELTPRNPMAWSAKDGAYQDWDQTVASDQSLAVTYALSAPNWSGVAERWGGTFVMKATVTVGGKDQTVQHDVTTETQTRLPPGAVT